VPPLYVRITTKFIAKFRLFQYNPIVRMRTSHYDGPAAGMEVELQGRWSSYRERSRAVESGVELQGARSISRDGDRSVGSRVELQGWRSISRDGDRAAGSGVELTGQVHVIVVGVPRMRAPSVVVYAVVVGVVGMLCTAA
jgi:hypothetical protein